MRGAALAESGLQPSRLEIELTKSALLDDFGLARGILAELKALGVRLALDDFGTGYSSLRHLQVPPIDKIKIDAGFARSLAESRKIVAAVVELGRSLGLPTVAGGVEDAAAAGLLVAGLGYNVGQGWLFGRAVPEGRPRRSRPAWSTTRRPTRWWAARPACRWPERHPAGKTRAPGGRCRRVTCFTFATGFEDNACAVEGGRAGETCRTPASAWRDVQPARSLCPRPPAAPPSEQDGRPPSERGGGSTA